MLELSFSSFLFENVKCLYFLQWSTAGTFTLSNIFVTKSNVTIFRRESAS